MVLRLSCPHGHQLKIPEDLAAQPVVCECCGTITMYRGRDTSKMFTATIDSEAGPVDSRAVATSAVDVSSGDWNETFDSQPAVDNKTQGDKDPTDEDLADPAAASDPVAVTEDSIIDPGGSVQPPSQASQPEPSEPAGPPELDGYEIIAELGRGGMGVVYRAHDQVNDRFVALKTLQRLNPRTLHRFKAEFRTLADIAHPNLASLYELLSDGDTWCFSMEILDGVDLLQYIWSGFEHHESDAAAGQKIGSGSTSQRLTEARLERLTDAMAQLAIGLSTLHNAGILHSDIKPSNVLVTTEGRVVLLDFGLAAPVEQSRDRRGFVHGTPRYMSPEQSRAEPLAPASDWYAVGVMLYELLTGRAPFQGTLTQMITSKRNSVAVNPAQLQPDNPPHLNELCRALLSQNPDKRPSAAEVLRALGADDVAEAVGASQQAMTRSVKLVGREQQAEVLRDSLDRVAQGNTLTALVHGRSGMGKSVLIRHFLDAIKEKYSAVVLEGRCFEQESVPFKALDSLIDALSVLIGSLRPEIIHSVMPRDRLALTRVFPVLGGAPEIEGAAYPSIDNADQQELRQRALNALRELLQRLAIREPLVLCIDDLQWGDADSAALLVDLVRPPDAPRILLIASYRSEDIGRSSCLQALEDAFNQGQHQPERVEVLVEALTQGESQQLALALLEGDDQANLQRAAKIARESGGWPFFVWELVQHVQEDRDTEVHTLDLDEVIWTRVNRLPPDTIRMLEVIAVAGRPRPTSEIFQCLRKQKTAADETDSSTGADSWSQGPSLLAHLRANHFVRTTESEDEQVVVETYHDRIRESVLNHLTDQSLRSYSLNLAETLEQLSGLTLDQVNAHIALTPAFEEPTVPFDLDKQQWQRVFDIAHYLDVAGEHERAFPYALLAAEQSRMQNSLEVAEQQFQFALRGADSFASELQFRVHEGLGDVLEFRGRYDQASEQFQAARKLISGDELLARIDWKLGVTWFKKGDMGEARDFLERSIRQLGERPPSRATVIPRALKEAVVQTTHTLLPGRIGKGDSKAESGRLDLLRARIYDQLTFSYWFTRGMNFVLWSHLRQMNIAERYPPSSALGKTYAFHAVTMTGLPMARRGISYANRAYEISQELGDLWGQGKARSYHTFACIVLAEFKEGLQMGLEAVQLLEQAGDVWEANMARMIATVPMFHLGDLKSAYRESKKAYEIGMETGDYSAVCISLLFWIPTNPKTIPPGAIQTELDRPRDDPLTITAAVYARGLELLLCEDEPAEAAKVLQDSLDQARRLGLRNVCLFSAKTWKATALRIVAEREPEGPRRRKAIAAAKKAVGAALRITKLYVACRPHALRERAIIAHLEEREQQAQRYFDESLQVAQSYEAEYDKSQTLLARGQAGIKFGWPDAETQVAEGSKLMKELENQ